MLKNYLRRSLKKFHRQHYIFEIVIGAVLIAIVGSMVWLGWRGRISFPKFFGKQSETQLVTPASRQPKQKLTRRTIDGVFVKEGQEKPPLVGVMIENMIEAQPITGLDKANLVFEAVTEANITRFLAIYAIEEGKEGKEGGSENFEIGPVRSARPYYLDWVSEFGALYAHVGGSPEANRLIKQGTVEDLDQWFKSQYFWRETNRPRAHNVYTSIDLLKEAQEKEVFEQKEFEGWLFKDDAPLEERGNIEKISIGYVSPYDVNWQYNKETNEYVRYQWGDIHKTADGRVLKAKNIATVWLPMKVLDEIGRKWFGTIGEDKAVVFRDGQAIEGTWRKTTKEDRMRFFDKNGEEIKFNAGITWVEVVPEGTDINF